MCQQWRVGGGPGLRSYLSYEIVELLLGLESLDLLVYSLVFLQLLQVCPTTVEVRTGRDTNTPSGLHHSYYSKGVQECLQQRLLKTECFLKAADVSMCDV